MYVNEIGMHAMFKHRSEDFNKIVGDPAMRKSIKGDQAVLKFAANLVTMLA